MDRDALHRLPVAGIPGGLSPSPTTRRASTPRCSTLAHPAARRVLVERLRALLADTGAHGFKLDFLERFARDGGDPPVDADAALVEEGGLLLLDEIAALGGAEPLMIEFREPYITAPPSRAARCSASRTAR